MNPNPDSTVPTTPVEYPLASLGNPLIGLCFLRHVRSSSDAIDWRGVVLGRPEPGWYLVRLFLRRSGDIRATHLVRIEDMRDWYFYEDREIRNQVFPPTENITKEGSSADECLF